MNLNSLPTNKILTLAATMLLAVRMGLAQAPPPLPSFLHTNDGVSVSDTSPLESVAFRPTMLRAWSFDAEDFRASFGVTPTQVTNVTRAASWSGTALVMEQPPALLRYRALEPTGEGNISCRNGAISFWFKPAWTSLGLGGKGPGVLGRFLQVGTASGATSNCWAFYLDPEGAHVYFGVLCDGEAIDYLHAPIRWNAGDWHHLLLSYTPSNSAFYLDGQLATKGTGVTCWPNAVTREAYGLFLGGDDTGTRLARGQFEDFRTYNIPLDGARVASNAYAAGLASMAASQANPILENGSLNESTLTRGELNSFETLTLEGEGGLSSVTDSNGLWLEIAVCAPNLTLTLHNAGAGTNYQFYSRAQVDSGLWNLEAEAVGLPDANLVTVILPLAGRTNWFLHAGVGNDSDGDGLPDVYEVLVTHTDPFQGDTGTTGLPDGLKDPDGDGWSNMEEYRNRHNPYAVDPAPALQGVFQARDAANLNVIEWSPPTAFAASYVIERNTGSGWNNVAVLSGTETSFTDTNLAPGAGASYRVTANYGAVSSAAAGPPSGSVEPGFTVPALVVGGPENRLYFVGAQPTAELKGFYLTRYPLASIHPKDNMDDFYSGAPRTSFYPTRDPLTGFLSSSNLTGSPVPLSTGFFPFYGTYRIECRGVGQDDRYGNATDGSFYHYATPFLDGRQHLLDNLHFVLRAGTVSGQYNFYFPGHDSGGGQGVAYGMYADRAVAGFHWKYAGSQNSPDPSDPFQPFEDSSIFRSFCYDESRFDSFGNSLNVDYTGASAAEPVMKSWFYYVSSLGLAQSGTTNAPARQLTETVSQYIFQRRGADGENLAEIGLTWDAGLPGWRFASSARNIYGIPLLSVRCVKQTATAQPLTIYTASPGGTIPAMGTPGHPSNGWFYVQTESPVLQTIGFHTALGTWLQSAPDTQFWSGLEESGNILMSLGQRLNLRTWAKMSIVNGYTNKVAYLQQYFDKAFQITPEGIVTTNETGVLSEYGEFFPTEPGRVALVTKPDLTGGSALTNLVHVLKLEVDVNHDGTMDGRFMGPDNTSAERPFVFWANNDYDRGHMVDGTDSEEDDLSKEHPHLIQKMPDYAYTNLSGYQAIPGLRDLEDYARLWTTGLTNLFSILPTNVVVELAWRTTAGSNPTLRLFQAVETDGGTAYLIDEGTAEEQIGTEIGTTRFVGVVSSNSPLQLNNRSLLSPPLTEKYLFCGVTRGTGELVLRVRLGTTNLVETSVFIQIKDIKEMYERWTVGDAPGQEPYPFALLASEDLPTGIREFTYAYSQSLHTNTPYILHVHGWNMERWEKDRFAEAAFKRLFWQGYEGRFGSFRWPTKTGALSFDSSEFTAWKCGTSLHQLLRRLNLMHPGRVYLTAHSMGNVVASEALQLAGTNGVANTFIAMQGAIASHAFDPTTPQRTIFPDSLTPDRHAEYWTNGSPCYFSSCLPAAPKCINFYNANDWALTLLWRPNEDLKPDFGYTWSAPPSEPERYYYTDIWNNVRGLYFPQDTYEILSFITEARCEAVGAQANVGGPFKPAASYEQLDLDASPYAFGSAHKGHSGQFRSNVIKRWQFWRTVIQRLDLAP